ncbi:MAG: right-handed parallel beta-helix repeat-containing protein [Phycisphaerales bacterium]|nr:right-handed parallel beta-helix repeat-containing protein [Phycisphaerales bacterium]
MGFPHFDNCVFDQCSASGNGGAVLVQNYAGPTFTNCQFTDNWAQKGGAIYVTESSAVVLNGCDISNNQGWWYGGGLYLLDECVASIANSTIVGNYGSMQGGGIYSQCGTVDLSDSVVEGNHASLGGGMSFTCGDGFIQNVDFRDNVAKVGGHLSIAYAGPPPGDPLANVQIADSNFCGAELPIDGPWNDAGGNIFYGSCTDGACCTNGTCVLISEPICTMVGGDYQGVGIFCEDVNCPGECPADLNQDGFVGSDDLLHLIADWGVCP